LTISREAAGRALTLAGLAAAVPSVRQTVEHITDETYRAPEVRHGRGHVQYHMAREALITSGALTTVVLGAANSRGDHATWRGMAAATAGFVAAMWSGGPTTGVWAPNRTALAGHVASTSALSIGVWLLRPPSRRTNRR
jgi:hypothetical protein